MQRGTFPHATVATCNIYLATKNINSPVHHEFIDFQLNSLRFHSFIIFSELCGNVVATVFGRDGDN